MKIACFDLEGPLSPQDNAFEVSSKINNGKELFEKISRYDDYLAQQDRVNHEPGDTLALIAPFLVHEGICEEDIFRASNKAKIVSGAKELIKELKKDEWEVYIISTSYKQHAYSIGEKLGVEKNKIYATDLDLGYLKQKLNKDLVNKIEEVKSTILESKFSSDLIDYLDDFFFNELLKTDWGNLLEEINVRGGKQKIDAVNSIVKEKGIQSSEITVIGDSITDYKMLDEIKNEGGESIVFNGNRFAIPYAKYGVASLDIRAIRPIMEINEPIDAIKKWEKNQEKIDKDINNIPMIFNGYGLKEIFSDPEVKNPVLNYLPNKDSEEIDKVVKLHKYFRENVRGEAAKLG